jgi:predicted alpha/beta hydrolase family esterase
MARPRSSQDVILIVHGVDGSGPWYGGLARGLGKDGPGAQVQYVEWGGPLMILPNLQWTMVHENAQKRLAKRIGEWRAEHPSGRICLVGHSAGCGVILGMLADGGPEVDEVLLLAPAISAKYDLAPAMGQVRGRVHVFYSEHDELLLKYGTGLAGTYDHVWGESAGLCGFVGADSLPDGVKSRLLQHPYDPAWKALGYDGGHFGCRDKRFAREVLAPLLAAPAL